MRQVDLLRKVFTENDRVCVVVLDALNIKIFKKLYKDKYNILEVWSDGYDTKSWLENTFIHNSNNEVFREVVYISGNPWTSILHDKLSKVFKRVIDVSVKFWNSELGTVEPKYVTLTTKIFSVVEKKLLVHYLQPHPPFLTSRFTHQPSITLEEIGKRMNVEYVIARCNPKARRLFKKLYIENLKLVMSEVERKLTPHLKSRRFKIYLTADHGEILSKWRPNPRKLKWVLGICKYVGHFRNFKELHIVPFIEIT